MVTLIPKGRVNQTVFGVPNFPLRSCPEYIKKNLFIFQLLLQSWSRKPIWSDALISSALVWTIKIHFIVYSPPGRHLDVSYPRRIPRTPKRFTYSLWRRAGEKLLPVPDQWNQNITIAFGYSISNNKDDAALHGTLLRLLDTDCFIYHTVPKLASYLEAKKLHSFLKFHLYPAPLSTPVQWSMLYYPGKRVPNIIDYCVIKPGEASIDNFGISASITLIFYTSMVLQSSILKNTCLVSW